MYMTQTAINVLSAHSSECLFTHILRIFFKICSPSVYFSLAVWFSGFVQSKAGEKKLRKLSLYYTPSQMVLSIK